MGLSARLLSDSSQLVGTKRFHRYCARGRRERRRVRLCGRRRRRHGYTRHGRAVASTVAAVRCVIGAQNPRNDAVTNIIWLVGVGVGQGGLSLHTFPDRRVCAANSGRLIRSVRIGYVLRTFPSRNNAVATVATTVATTTPAITSTTINVNE